MEDLLMLLDIIQWEEGLNKIHVDPVAYTIVPELADPLHHRFPYIKRGNHPIIQIPVTIGNNIYVKKYMNYTITYHILEICFSQHV